jgi:hypothetical protein
MASTYTPIATQTLGSAQSSYTFSSIPSTYTDLVLIINGYDSTPGTASLGIQFNSDTGSNYSVTGMLGDGTSASSYRQTSQSASNIGTFFPTTGMNIVNIMNYANTTTYKTMLGRVSTAASRVAATVGLWRSTAAINRIDLTIQGDNFAIGSTFTLYGILAA